MQHPDYNSPAALKSFMEENGMAMQKKFGQNFMINSDSRKKIISYLELNPEDRVFEVGPGLGCMTEEILNSGARLTAFEIDYGFIELLHQFFEKEEKNGQFNIVEGDVLKKWNSYYNDLNLSLDEKGVSPVKFFGNLPYNIAATFIADTVTKNVIFKKGVFTLQKEVTQRILAKPSTENYSSFSVLCQFAYDVKAGIETAPGCFWPKPNVSSQTVILTPKEKPYECSNRAFFVKLVHGLFLSRRKTISNNIKPFLSGNLTLDELFSRTGISPNQRAENLKVEDFLLLSETISGAIL